MQALEINIQFEQVLRFVNQTNQIIFLTGKAGTGKTTLLKYIRKNTYKQMAVVAPTGVAAINAGGSTIHSFFQFPFTPFLPPVSKSGELLTKSLPVLKYNAQRLAIFRNLELLVIDEISMVRADLLDQIDFALRQTRKKWHLPFGGVQVMLIGDMHQLPPVVQSEEWKLLSQVYPSPYFFDSLVIKNNSPLYIELEKIYRQSDDTFITLLNKVRNNVLDKAGLELLNSHYKKNITKEDYQSNTTLTTHHKKADEINAGALRSLPGKEYKFKSEVDGLFPEKNYPADEVLVLKEGARVMFLKNNAEKNYYNGKTGIVSFIDDKKIKVKCDEDRNEIEVQKEAWNNVAFKVDKSTRQIDEEIVGSFTQFPLRHAWAITIHKSQGLTFDKLIIDAAEAFTSGQVYVALSRCRGLQGLTLSSIISPTSLMNDAEILKFSEGKHNGEQVNHLFGAAQKSYLKTVLLNLFDFSDIKQSRVDLAGAIIVHKAKLNTETQDWAQQLFTLVDQLSEVSVKFHAQLSGLMDATVDPEQDNVLQERLVKASAYFETECEKCLTLLQNCVVRTESKEAATEINALLQEIFEAFFQKVKLIASCRKGFVFSDFIKQKLSIRCPDFRINVYATAKNSKISSDVKNPDLYRQLLLLRDEICNDNGKPIYLVASNKTLKELSEYLPVTEEQLLNISGFGEAKVQAFGAEFLKLIKEYAKEHGMESSMEIKPSKKKKKKEKPAETKGNSMEETYKMFRQGIILEEIARQRGFALSTIEGHLARYVASGELNVDYLLSREKQKVILDALENYTQEAGITPVKNALPPEISYSEIRYMVAFKNRKAEI